MSSIAPEDIYMIDQWPGAVNPNLGIPTGGFDNTTTGGSNATTALYPPATKIMAWNDTTISTKGTTTTLKGYYTMIYLQYLDYTSGKDVTASDVVGIACSSAKAKGILACTRDISGGADITQDSPLAIAIKDVCESEYAWYWCDGVAPLEDCTGLDVTGVVTGGGVECGMAMGLATGLTVVGFTLCGPSGYLPCAYAMADDT